MTTGRLTEDNLLTLFPAAKNFPIKESLTDPYHELMSEMDRYVKNFNHDEKNEALNASDMIINDFEKYESLDQYMNRHQQKENSKNLEKDMKKEMQKKIKTITENQLRIKYYLEEIEMFGRLK